MKKILLCLILVLLYDTILIAQTPDWSVKENAYQHTMTFVAKLNVDGKRLINSNDKVAAFVDNTCRGVSGVTYVANEKNYYAYLTVFSNTQGETISFKLYDSATDKITAVSKQIVFEVNEHKGNLFQSYSIAEPALNNMSELLSFNFMDITSSLSVINSGTVKIDISESNTLTNLKPIFTLSKGATLLKNKVLQKPGEITDDFSSTITYEVLSEDESTISTYHVTVNKVKDPAIFYKKDAVCYARGAIKVRSKEEGATVQISSNGKSISTKQIVNGEAIFPDLEVDSYVVTIGNEWKIINIALKDK